MNKIIFESLVSFRAIAMLMYNFNYETDIKPLMVHHSFAHGWQKIESISKKKKQSFIHDELIYKEFCQWDHNTQALFIDRAMQKYGKEAREGLQSAIILDNMAKEHIEKYSTES
ncbi:MAG TPA: hypothetical protein VFJ43_06800 [Bacteroidia bacterium]|nr:hypothetical protein [Bacteroidia bacterium]